MFEFNVISIKVQKDEYRTMEGKSLGETAFWQSQENEAEVLQFKRAIATCRLTGPDILVDLELIISLRAGFVRVRLTDPTQGHEASGVAKILQELFAVLHHKPGYDGRGALTPVFSRDRKKYFLCKTYDSHWLVATLHEIKDEKGMPFSVPEAKLQELVKK